jgi:DNA polymerase-3 subunit gamma/tau
MAAVEEEVTTPLPEAELPPLDEPALAEALNEFRRGGDDTLCMFLDQASPEISGEADLILRFGSARAIACVREDATLIDFLRTYFQRPHLTMRLEQDDSLKPARSEIKKRLSAKDKFLSMRDKNPALDELRRRFDLRPEE